MQAMLAAIRHACPPEVWSDGVTLARSGNVSGVAQRKGEADLRVAEIGGLKSAAVTLYTNDEEWTCDCDSTDDACKHVAAAAIALNRAGRALFEQQTLAHVGYRFREENGALVFDRVLVSGTDEQPLTKSLSESSTAGARFAATDADMTVEVLLGTRPRGALIREHWQKLWPSLRECEDVRVDGVKVTLGDPAPLEGLAISDAGEGFRVSVAPRNGAKVFDNGVAFAGDRLFVATAPPEELAIFAKGQTIAAGDVAAFVTDVLPRLRDVLSVDVRTKRLPEQAELAPRVVFDVAPQASGLNVLPTLVYGDPPSARIDGERLVWLGGALPFRRPREEQRLRDAVSERVGVKLGERRFVLPDDAPQTLQKIAEFSGRDLLAKDARVHASMTGGTLRLTLSAGAATVDHDSLAAALRAGQSLVALSDGRFAAVPPSLRDLDLVARLLHGRAALAPTERVEAARVLAELAVPLPPDLAPLSALFGDHPTVPRATLPADLQATLRPYQQDGVDWLVFLRRAGLGALLADDMGLGKTVQTIASLDAGPHLVVAPASVLSVWERELAKFRPSLRVCRYHGPKRTLMDADVTITTYGTLRQDDATLAARAWATVILDEAQAVKNADSQTARAAFALRAEHRIALSGTPIENSLDELWSVFHFLAPGWLGSRADQTDAKRMGARVRPFVLRRKKESVARDLPPRTESVLACELSADERAIYDAVHAAKVPSVLKALDESVMSALEALLRLRQAASHPRLLPGYETWPGASAKVQTLTAMLEQLVAEGHKALLFSQWTSFLDLVEPALSMPFARLDGATADRKAVVERFESRDGPPVMLISLKAGGTGLTLTAADYVFLLDPWWNPAVEEQAAARAHRIGQTKPVFVYRLIAKDTVEERLLALQAAKRALFDAALGDEALAEKLTKEELRALLA